MPLREFGLKENEMTEDRLRSRDENAGIDGGPCMRVLILAAACGESEKGKARQTDRQCVCRWMRGKLQWGGSA